MTQFRPLAIPDVVEIVPTRSGDHRGFFSEVYKRAEFAAAGADRDWLQDNQSLSAQAGTVRGLHCQVPPVAQAKLVRVLRGAIFDVAVDLRRGSPHYAQWVGRSISAHGWNQVLIPAGFAHGFMTLEPDTEVFYKVDAPWSREDERVIQWDDPAIGIAWPTGMTPVMSDKDRTAGPLAEFDSPFNYERV